MIGQVAATLDVQTLHFELHDVGAKRVTPNDVGDLAALVAEELDHLQQEFPNARRPVRAYHPGRRFPAHVFQRAGLLKRILRDLVEARQSAAMPTPRGG